MGARPGIRWATRGWARLFLGRAHLSAVPFPMRLLGGLILLGLSVKGIVVLTAWHR